jgi:hypothetical protein
MSNKIIEKTFQQLYGKPCWGLDYSESTLSMNIGEPSLRIREPFYKTSWESESYKLRAARRIVTVRGKWWLWIYCCYWRLSIEGLQPVTGTSSKRKIQQAFLSQLSGQKLISVTIKPATGATRFEFDLGGVLECRRVKKNSDADIWSLYKPSGYVLSVHGKGTYSHQRGTATEKRFHQIEDDV